MRCLKLFSIPEIFENSLVFSIEVFEQPVECLRRLTLSEIIDFSVEIDLVMFCNLTLLCYRSAIES